MSQSAASTALKELEQRYDLQLFDRIGKRLQLNEAGSALRRRAAALLSQASELENSLLAHTEVGELKALGQHGKRGEVPVRLPALRLLCRRQPALRIQGSQQRTPQAAPQRIEQPDRGRPVALSWPRYSST